MARPRRVRTMAEIFRSLNAGRGPCDRGQNPGMGGSARGVFRSRAKAVGTKAAGAVAAGAVAAGAVAAVTMTGALLGACGGHRDARATANPVSTFGDLPVGMAPPGPPPEPQAAPVGKVTTVDPTAVATLLAAAAAAPPARMVPYRAEDDDPAAVALRAAAAQYAPGMTPLGDSARANLFEGAHASFVATLDNSRCYAIVAAGDGITELDMHVLLPPFNNLLAGEDGMTGPIAAVGTPPNIICPTLVTPFDYKVDLQATKGGGTVAAQLYAKQK